MGSVSPPQAVSAKVHQVGSGNRAQHRRRYVLHDDLAAMGGGHQPRGDIDGVTEVVPVTFLRLSGVQPHPHAPLHRWRPGHMCPRDATNR
jgi:hypothetical protein